MQATPRSGVQAGFPLDRPAACGPWPRALWAWSECQWVASGGINFRRAVDTPESTLLKQPACNGTRRNPTDAKKAGTLDFSGLTGLYW